MADQMQLYEVFVRSRRGLDRCTWAACMPMTRPVPEYARDVYTRRGEGVSIWVVASRDITASQESDCESFYDPQDDKPYRHAAMYELPEEWIACDAG